MEQLSATFFGADACLKIRVFSAVVNSNMAELFAKRRWSQEEISVMLGSSLCSDHFIPSINSRPLWRRTNQSNIARQCVVTERLRRVHLPRWKLPRHALYHPFRIDSGWKRYQERETDGILHSRESYVHSPTQAKGLRRDEAQNCSVQTSLENKPETQCTGTNLRVTAKGEKRSDEPT